MSPTKYLPIYLNDHLGGATLGVELVKRIAGEYEGTELGTFASGLAQEVEQDRDALRDIMRGLGAPTNQAKVAIGWVGEKVGRLKLNGELRDPSPLSPLVELEGLCTGIEGKRMLWTALAETPELADRIGRARLDELLARAEDQRTRAEEQRRAHAARALAAA